MLSPQASETCSAHSSVVATSSFLILDLEYAYVDVAGFLTVRFHDNERAWLYLRDLPDLLGNGEAAPFLHKNTQCDDPTPRLMNSLATQLTP